jgi:hypothetical protein
MIGYVDKLPTIQPHGDGFILGLQCGDSEIRFMLTLHALSGLAHKGGLLLEEAQAKSALFEPTPFQLRPQGEEPARKTTRVKRPD